MLLSMTLPTDWRSLANPAPFWVDRLTWFGMQELKKLVIAAWDPNPERRPDMRTVVDTLDDQLRMMSRPAGGGRLGQGQGAQNDAGTGGSGSKCCSVQ